MKQTYSYPPVPLGMLSRGDDFFSYQRRRQPEIGGNCRTGQPRGVARRGSMVRLSVDAPWMGAGGPDAAGAIGNVRAVGRHSHFLPDHPGRRSRFHITQHSRQFARYLGGSHVRVKLTGAPARFNDLKNIHFREKQYAKANHAIGARDTH